MQQSLQILQAPTLELRSLVQQELAENPTLEDETSEISLEERSFDDEEFDEEFSKLSRLDDEWREYWKQSQRVSPRSAADEEKRQFMLDSLVRPATLQEHLLEQLHTEGVDDPKLAELAEFLIGNLDEHGYLPTPIDELSLRHHLPLRDLEAAKALIQQFEPAGVGAESLRECLLIQLERQERRHSLEYRIVANHLDDLAHRRYPQIARKLAIQPEQVARAAEVVASLDPKPGRAFESGDNRYVTPDVFVERTEEGELSIRLNNEQIPRLRISNVYKDLMAEEGNKTDVRSYIREKIRSGKTLIQSIQQRQETIRNIAEQIVMRQRDFMERGPRHLRPMTMSQVAETVGVHETTVSRALAGKFISTPQGVFEMKYFFTTGYETDSGESMSNTSVKSAIAEMVAEEDRKKPLSDKAIADLLAEKGIHIARRTVAKYREELDILPSHMRKGY